MNQTILHTGSISVSSAPHLSRSVAKANELLADQPHLRSKASQILVELLDSGFVLTGNLPSFFLKQMAQETLRPLGLPISNRIRIQS